MIMNIMSDNEEEYMKDIEIKLPDSISLIDDENDDDREEINSNCQNVTFSTIAAYPTLNRIKESSKENLTADTFSTSIQVNNQKTENSYEGGDATTTTLPTNKYDNNGADVDDSNNTLASQLNNTRIVRIIQSTVASNDALQNRAKTVRIGRVRWPPALETSETFETELQKYLKDLFLLVVLL